MSFVLKLAILLLTLGAFGVYTSNEPIDPNQTNGEGGSPPPPKP
jgi:hypothetical protein